MIEQERRLLDRNDLNKLYELTNPKLSPKPTLHTVVSYYENEWKIEDSHLLRGYRACNRTLESKVRRYEAKGAWPTQCQLGIGLFENDKLIHVLIAKDLGVKPSSQVKTNLPLDDILSAIGLSRNDVM